MKLLILEDTVELQCRSDDHVGMRSEPGVTTMADLELVKPFIAEAYEGRSQASRASHVG